MATSTGTLQMRRLHSGLGVEIGGVAPHLPLDSGTWARIWEAFNEHSLLIWDKRCLLHRGRPWDAKRHARVMHRTTVAGEGPTA